MILHRSLLLTTILLDDEGIFNMVERCTSSHFFTLCDIRKIIMFYQIQLQYHFNVCKVYFNIKLFLTTFLLQQLNPIYTKATTDIDNPLYDEKKRQKQKEAEGEISAM